jgi:mannitol/fructose-specific phosphotransferase system IIA component (Ntr-type)
MRLSDFLRPESVSLALAGSSKDEILAQLVALLRLPDNESESLRQVLRRREQLGSTGVGRGIAIPHCRTPIATQLRLAFGNHPAGVQYDAIDGQPVYSFFLIVAPPVEISNVYLPVLGRIAQLAKEPDVPERLRALPSPGALLDLLAEKGV